MTTFRDGKCPKCGGHTYGTPLHCDKCGWQESQESANEFQKIIEKISLESKEGAAMSAKDDFLKIYTESIHRDGADKLLEWLKRSDFFTAPASAKYHGNHEGGLCEHSLNVWRRLSQECDSNAETVAICGLLHDVCKVNFYVKSTRNVKNEQTGEWEKQPYYSVDDKVPYGHGEKSVYIISGFMRLTREEAFAIRFHMGDYSDRNVPQAFRLFPLALMLHIADLEATFLDEKEG